MCLQNCQQDSDKILPGVCKALKELKISFGVSNMMEQVQSLRNNKITAACIGGSADIDRKLASGTAEFRLGKMNVKSFVSRWNRFELLIATFRLQYC